MENTSADGSYSVDSSILSLPPDSSQEDFSTSFLANDDYSTYAMDVFTSVPALQSPLRGELVFPHPDGVPEEDADEVDADSQANESSSSSEAEEEVEEEEEEDQLESSPIRPPPQVLRAPLPPSGFASVVPIALPPRAGSPQLGGGYRHLQAEPDPNPPATRFRPRIKPSNRGNVASEMLHKHRNLSSAPSLSAPPIATLVPPIATVNLQNAETSASTAPVISAPVPVVAAPATLGVPDRGPPPPLPTSPRPLLPPSTDSPAPAPP
ncbi:hypothetical protein R3P38DRAFT_3230679 [Favolaschia claudopus]|uniref:Uncharacterized protein n=1 Tax=Favolaschia claudopus TaxID=2862362 RepID=A0AAV9ZME3_9AGAR